MVQASIQENYRKATEVIRRCEDDERGAHSEKNARFGHSREKKQRATKTRYDRGGVEREQSNKRGRIEEEDNQLYWRPQMTGQVRDYEEYIIKVTHI